MQFPLGSRVPLHCTASGKLFLSTLPKNKRKAVISKLKLEAHAKNTITDVGLLLEEVDKIEALKISIDNEELYDGVIAIAVPITDPHGRFYSSLAIQAPIFRFSVERAMDYETLLREAAQDLSTLTEEL